MLIDSRWGSSVAAIGVLLLCHPLPAAQKKADDKGAPPKVVVAMPMAVEMGKTTKITLRGLRMDTATEIQLQEPRSRGKVLGNAKKIPVPNDANPEQVGDSEIDIEVTLPKEVAGGFVPFTIIGPGGESKPHQLIVKDDTRIILEKESNDGFKQAQPITIPCIIEGTIRQPQDVDVFQFNGKKGEQITFEIQASRFGSSLDGSLTLYDGSGRTVASADDSSGSTDPMLSVKLPSDGDYYLALIDARDQGGSIYVYRLLIRRKQ